MNRKYLDYLTKKKELISICPKCKGNNLNCFCYRDYIWCVKKVGAGIPFEFLDWDFSTFTVVKNKETIQEVKEYVDNIEYHYNKGEGIFLYGGKGGGKTSLASVALGQLLKKGYSGKFLNFGQCLNLEEFEDLLVEIRDKDFLVMDNFDIEYKVANEYVRTAVDRLFREREYSTLPVLMTTKFDPEEVEKIFGNKISSLLEGNLIKIKCGMLGDYRTVIKSKAREE